MDGSSFYILINISLLVLAVFACLLVICFIFLIFFIMKENFKNKFEKNNNVGVSLFSNNFDDFNGR